MAPDPNQKSTRGVADIVFLIDATGSMRSCIDALRNNISAFIDLLASGDGNQFVPVRDWRAKIVGFRDFEYCQEPMTVHPFVRDSELLKTHLNSLELEGSVDIEESLLEPLYYLATMGETESGVASHHPDQWRHRSDASRVVVAFTDAPYKEPMRLRGVEGGGLQDVAAAMTENRIILHLFAPDLPCYDRLSQIDRCEWEPVGEPGESPQRALADFTSDTGAFQETLRQLARSVSKSTEATV
jgi:hypothetical protein